MTKNIIIRNMFLLSCRPHFKNNTVSDFKDQTNRVWPIYSFHFQNDIQVLAVNSIIPAMHWARYWRKACGTAPKYDYKLQTEFVRMYLPEANTTQWPEIKTQIRRSHIGKRIVDSSDPTFQFLFGGARFMNHSSSLIKQWMEYCI
jgi:hypothetical protein